MVTILSYQKKINFASILGKTWIMMSIMLDMDMSLVFLSYLDYANQATTVYDLSFGFGDHQSDKHPFYL